MTKTFRCSICDSTNNIEVLNDPLRYNGHKRNYYARDSKTNDIICYDCVKILKSTMKDYKEKDSFLKR